MQTDLKVLVVSDDSTGSVEDALTVEGVPFTRVVLGQSGRQTINAAYLANTAGAVPVANFQAIVLPNMVGGDANALATAELDAIASYATTYGIRILSTYDWRTADNGLGAYISDAPLDGAQANVTAEAKTEAFKYLTGPFTFDNVDSAVNEIPGYRAAADSSLGTVKPYITSGGGIVVGTFRPNSGRWLGTESMFLTFQGQSDRVAFRILAPGILEWLTNGNHLGLMRNYLAVHIDDILNEDGRWDVTRNCTPDEDCTIDDPSTPAVETTTNPIRMTAADVSILTTWQTDKGIKLDMAYNAAPSVRLDGTSLTGTITQPGATTLTKALLDAKSGLRWINHTYDHEYYGCDQEKNTAGQWVCKSPFAYVSQSMIATDIANNLTWASRYGLNGLVDSKELISGEHSGLQEGPSGRITVDNPNFVNALSNTNPPLSIKVIASDNSREAASGSTQAAQRTVGGAVTLPRYPNSLYYNASTAAELVDEYNHIYLPPALGGVCAGSQTNTCLTTALLADGFTTYIAPFEARQTLSRVLNNDPRPHFTHQSNLAGDGLVYTWLQQMLTNYTAAVNTANTPIVQPTMTEAALVMTQQASWQAGQAKVSAYVKGGQLVVTNSYTGPVWVPVSAATGTTVNTATAWVDGVDNGYLGTRSAWKQLAAGASITIDVAANTLPAADFTSSCTLLNCTFDASASKDTDGTIATYAWSWGDNSTVQTVATAATPHSFPSAGTYTVGLTVTDNRGGTATKSVQVTVTGPPNVVPTAVAEFSCIDQKCTFDGTKSGDSDGTIAGYSWSFGDGSQGTGATAVHTYPDGGDFTATLTVTDDKGAPSAPVQIAVRVSKPNAAPKASFTVTCDGLACGVDASGSTDTDGSIALYAWAFGDGSQGTGVKPTGHIYASAGTYTITLTVFDDKGLSGHASRSVTVAGSSPILTPTPAPVPTPTVKAKAVSKNGKIKVDVDPNQKGKGYWKLQLQKKNANGTWTTLKKTYKTQGKKETRTINPKKGVYRVIVQPKYGYGTGTSPEVALKK